MPPCGGCPDKKPACQDRCRKPEFLAWKEEKERILADGKITHERSGEYASYIMEAIVTGNPYKIGGNVLNNGCISNLPREACVEVPCLVNGHGVNPCAVGALPVQCAAMNMTNINVQLLTIEAAVKLGIGTKEYELIEATSKTSYRREITWSVFN